MSHPNRTVSMLIVVSAVVLVLILLGLGPLAGAVFIAGWLLGWLA